MKHATTTNLAARTAILLAVCCAPSRANQPTHADSSQVPATARPAPASTGRPAKLTREGTFLIDRQGWVRPLGAERWAYVFDKTDDGRTDPPMALLPCLKLTEMRRVVEARPETVTFKVSGRVFVFKGRNFLLPTFFVTASQPVPATGTELAPADAQAASKSLDDLFGSNAADPDDPDAILKRINAATPDQSVPREARPDVSTGWTRPGASEQAPGNGEEAALGLLREGEMIVARRGRLLRATGGELVFACDNAPSPADKPRRAPSSMRLLPCLNLQEMERLITSVGAGLQFKISGTVYVYEGANYLLPTMYIIESDREGNLVPGQ